MKKVKVGIIGSGIISTLQAEGYLACEEAEIVAVCDIIEDSAKKAAEAWGVKKYYTDYKELLKDEEIDAVEILTPHHLHAEMAIAAAEAGKHISVIKPMAINVKQCDEMIKAAKDAGVILNINDQYIFFQPIQEAKKLIENGEIGQPKMIRMEHVAASPKYAELEKIQTESEWRKKREEYGGGLLIDAGYHYFAVARFLLGEISEVYAWIDNPQEVEEYPAIVSWTYEKRGIYGCLDCACAREIYIKSKYYSDYETIEIIGEKGIIWIPYITAKLVNNPPLVIYNDKKSQCFEVIEDDWGQSFVDEVSSFVRCVLGKDKPLLSGEDGKKLTQVIEAMYKSHEKRRAVKVNEIN